MRPQRGAGSKVKKEQKERGTRRRRRGNDFYVIFPPRGTQTERR
jgi:hypothetical protein